MKKLVLVIVFYLNIVNSFSQNNNQCDTFQELIKTFIQTINTRNFEDYKQKLDRKIIENHTTNVKGNDPNMSKEKFHNRSDEEFYNYEIKNFKTTLDSISKSCHKKKWKINEFILDKTDQNDSIETSSYEISFFIRKTYVTINLELIYIDNCYYYFSFPTIVGIKHRYKPYF